MNSDFEQYFNAMKQKKL